MAAGAKSKHFQQDAVSLIDQDPQSRTYLDFNATAPMRPTVRDAMMDALDRTGNPSSIHAEGRAVRAAIESARAEVAALVGVAAQAVTFTSGATEAAALALSPGLGTAGAGLPAARLIVGATEHPAVRQGHRFESSCVAILPVDAEGLVDREALAALLARPGRSLVAVQAANGETGVVQPMAAIAAQVHAAGGLLVCDAAQAAGRIDCRAGALGADVLLLSAHKLGGPQGVGAMVAGRGDLAFGTPLQRGGGQERGLRGGTENAPGVVGFGVAARTIRVAAEAAAMLALRDRLEAGLRALAPDVAIFGAGAPRLPNTTAFAVPGLPNETALIALDLAGVAVSTGSACSSGKVARSPTLEGMGVDGHLIGGLVRVSLGWSSRPADVDRFLMALATVLRRRATRALREAA